MWPYEATDQFVVLSSTCFFQCWVLNPEPHACYANTLPLIQIPHPQSNLAPTYMSLNTLSIRN